MEQVGLLDRAEYMYDFSVGLIIYSLLGPNSDNNYFLFFLLAAPFFLLTLISFYRIWPKVR